MNHDRLMNNNMTMTERLLWSYLTRWRWESMAELSFSFHTLVLNTRTWEMSHYWNQDVWKRQSMGRNKEDALHINLQFKDSEKKIIRISMEPGKEVTEWNWIKSREKKKIDKYYIQKAAGGKYLNRFQRVRMKKWMESTELLRYL